MVTTCGIFLLDKQNRILLCHPTNAPANSWSIPKGLPNEGETEWDAAKREFKEETGIELTQYANDVFEYKEKIPYKNGKKQLQAFIVKINKTIDIDTLHCSSMVECNEPFPECDAFMWASKANALKCVHETQKIILQSIL